MSRNSYEYANHNNYVFVYYSYGLAGHRTSGNAGQFKNPLVVAYYDVDYVKNIKGTNYWRNRYDLDVMNSQLNRL